MLLVTLHIWLEDLLTALGTMDVIWTKQCSFAIPKMVEQKGRIIPD